MRVSDLRKGNIYRYMSPLEEKGVMYTGTNFCPSKGWGYGFRAYNEESGKYDGVFNTLKKEEVDNMVSEL